MKSITDTLKTLIASHGIEIIQQPQRLKAILADLLPNEKRMRYLVELSLRAEIPNKLMAIQNETSLIRGTKNIALKHYFKEEYFLEDKAVKSVFDCWEELIQREINSDICYVTNDDGNITNNMSKNIFELETVTDIDGNIYGTIKIGKQTWMTENLRVSRFRNGDLIETTKPGNRSIYSERALYQWAYDENENNALKYGRLYTFFVVDDKRGVAPKGWHVPTVEEWKELQNYLIAKGYNYDDTKTENRIAKSLASKSEWKHEYHIGSIGNDISKNNKSNFNALPSGIRESSGIFKSIGMTSQWWCAGTTRYSHDLYAWSVYLFSFRNETNSDFCLKTFGYSIRCLKDRK